MPRPNFEKIAEVAWDEAAEIHRKIKHDDWLRAFEHERTYPIDPYLTARFEALSFQGKMIAQLNCNNGRELISLRLLGAGRCVGFDISTGVLAEARDLDAMTKAGCEFVKADCQVIPVAYYATFDIVLVTAGALCFVPDITKYFQQIANLLAPGGTGLIYEAHPLLNMFEMDRDREGAADLRFDYFRDVPKLHVQGLDYYTHKPYTAREIYYFHHTTADIVTASLAVGLAIDSMEELSFDPSQAFGQAAFPVSTPMGLVLQLTRCSHA